MFWICSNQHRATQGWGWSHGSNNCTFNICFWSVKLEIHMELIKNVMCADRWAHPSWFNNAKSSQRIYIDLLYSNHQTKWIVIYQNYIYIYITIRFFFTFPSFCFGCYMLHQKLPLYDTLETLDLGTMPASPLLMACSSSPPSPSSHFFTWRSVAHSRQTKRWKKGGET